MRRLTLIGALVTLGAAIAANSAPAARSHHKIVVHSGESVRCPKGRAGCVVRVRATALTRGRHPRRVTIGRARIALRPATTRELTFRLNPAGRRLLHGHRQLPATLTVIVRHGHDAPILLTHVIHIDAPRKRHR